MKKTYQIYCRCEAIGKKHIIAESFGEALKKAGKKNYPIDINSIGHIGKCHVDKTKSYIQLQQDIKAEYQNKKIYIEPLF